VAQNNLQEIEQMIKDIQDGKMMPANLPPEIANQSDPQVILDYLNNLVNETGQLDNAVENYETNAKKEYKIRQDLTNQQNKVQPEGGVVADVGGAAGAAYSKAKVYNFKKAQMAQSTLSNPVPNTGTASALKFRTASDLNNWLNQHTRQQAEHSLMEMVPDDQKETITSALEEYYESNLLEEEKLEIAVKLWPIIPDIAKEDVPGVEEGTMELPYVKAEQILDFVKNIDQDIQKKAQADAKINKVGKTSVYNLKKTAQHKGMENVIMYGPGQMRIDPFLRQPVSDWNIMERNKGFGLVLDDVWNIDWESVWRGNIMDKYSRPYRDTKTGEWVGGYIQKRFEVDKWIPEENNMQLLPGQKRKPYMPEMRSTEARLEAMRAKEADKRGYAPASSGAPYDWNTANTKPFNLKKQAEIEESKKKITKEADLAPSTIKDPFEIKEPRAPKGSDYINGPKKEIKAQYKCKVCDAQMPSPSKGKAPSMCSCGKYPWSEVAVLASSKRSPDKPGQQSFAPSMQPNTRVASHQCKECKCANKNKDKKIEEIKEQNVDLTDCGLVDCKSEEIKMMTPNLSDNNNREEDDIEMSAQDLAIDG